MSYPLIGLESTLSDERCDAVRLSHSKGGAERVYVRLPDEAWDLADESSDPVHTRDLLAALVEALGAGFDTLECFLGDEKVLYVLERGTVATRRARREKSERFGAAPVAESKPLAEALGIPASRRKAKFRQACEFTRIVLDSLPASGPPLRVLDCACGRSYLGFVLADALTTAGRRVTLLGIDSNQTLVEKCREIAGTLGWTNCTFQTADLAEYAAPAGSCDALVSLHACDTLTDEAIRIGLEARAPLIFVAPCCQHQLRHAWKTHPLQWTARYGLVEQRVADALTDGFRCLVLEAFGYRVNVLRFTSQEVTPKNLLIRARLAGSGRADRLAEAREFMRQFNVRPRLAGVLDSAPV